MKTINIVTIIILLFTFFIIIPASSEDPPKRKAGKIKKDTVKVDPAQIKVNNKILMEQKISGDSLSVELDSILQQIKRKK